MQNCVLYLMCCLDTFMKQAIMTDGRQYQSQEWAKHIQIANYSLVTYRRTGYLSTYYRTADAHALMQASDGSSVSDSSAQLTTLIWKWEPIPRAMLEL